MTIRVSGGNVLAMLFGLQDLQSLRDLFDSSLFGAPLGYTSIVLLLLLAAYEYRKKDKAGAVVFALIAAFILLLITYSPV
jgi:hypothetical protein